MIVSSRKEDNVKATVQQLREKGIDAAGCVCHVSNPEHRKNMIQLVLGIVVLDMFLLQFFRFVQQTSFKGMKDGLKQVKTEYSFSSVLITKMYRR